MKGRQTIPTWKLTVELSDPPLKGYEGIDPYPPYTTKQLTKELKRVLGDGELYLKVKNFKLEEVEDKP